MITAKNKGIREATEALREMSPSKSLCYWHETSLKLKSAAKAESVRQFKEITQI